MSTPRDRPAAAALDGKVYVIGGSNSTGALPSMEVYDPAANTWTAKASMPTAKRAPGAATANGRIYVMGGDTSVYEYNPATNTWAARSPLPATPVDVVAVASISGHIFVAFNTGSNTRPSLYRYDPFRDAWERRADHPDVRSIASLGIANGMIYAVGGGFPGQSPSETPRVDRYDPMNDRWTTNATPPLATRRTHLGPTLPTVGGKMYVIGGWDGYSALTSVEVYDPWTNIWTGETAMPTARYAVAYAAVGYKIYAIGGNYGGAGGHWLTTNEELALSQPPSAEPPILFVSTRDGYYEIYSINGDGTKELRLTNDGYAEWHVAWTLDAERILFSVDGRGSFDIYLTGFQFIKRAQE
jgi:N-acetylneuraminic acid mutarotase